jgi:hypothetical protein
VVREERGGVSLDIYIVALFLSLPSRDEAKGAEEVGNPRPIIPVGLVLLVLRGCGLAMKEKPIIGATGWSYYPYPSICWQAGSPVWRIEPAASGLQRDVYGCLREVAGVADRSLPGLCVFISPQQRAQIDPAAGTPLAGIVKGKADTPCDAGRSARRVPSCQHMLGYG